MMNTTAVFWLLYNRDLSLEFDKDEWNHNRDEIFWSIILNFVCNTFCRTQTYCWYSVRRKKWCISSGFIKNKWLRFPVGPVEIGFMYKYVIQSSGRWNFTLLDLDYCNLNILPLHIVTYHIRSTRTRAVCTYSVSYRYSAVTWGKLICTHLMVVSYDHLMWLSYRPALLFAINRPTSVIGTWSLVITPPILTESSPKKVFISWICMYMYNTRPLPNHKQSIHLPALPSFLSLLILTCRLKTI